MFRGIVFTFLTSVLYAKEIPSEKLESIHTEAIAFVLVILVMSIISYKISAKNAREYALKNKLKIQQQKQEKKDEIQNKENRVKELQQMLDDGLITNDEFKMMRKRLYNTEQE
jgi:uncharacterized protein YacL